jgi:hypothetical protein
MFGLMIRIRRDELRCGNRRRRAFRHFVGIMDILDYARPRQHETGLDGPDLIEDIMGKPRKEQPEAESIFANNPFIEGLFEWMDSPEGQQSIAVRDVLWDLLEGVQVDAKQRQLIWPGAKRTARKERLDLDQSVQRIQKMCPEFPGGEIEEFLLDWIDMGYDPENYSQAQLDELDKLTERWVADHRRKAKTSKKHKGTRHS